MNNEEERKKPTVEEVENILMAWACNYLLGDDLAAKRQEFLDVSEDIHSTLSGPSLDHQTNERLVQFIESIKRVKKMKMALERRINELEAEVLSLKTCEIMPENRITDTNTIVDSNYAYLNDVVKDIIISVRKLEEKFENVTITEKSISSNEKSISNNNEIISRTNNSPENVVNNNVFEDCQNLLRICQDRTRDLENEVEGDDFLSTKKYFRQNTGLRIMTIVWSRFLIFLKNNRLEKDRGLTVESFLILGMILTEGNTNLLDEFSVGKVDESEKKLEDEFFQNL
jgi:hypothetical protein